MEICFGLGPNRRFAVLLGRLGPDRGAARADAGLSALGQAGRRARPRPCWSRARAAALERRPVSKAFSSGSGQWQAACSVS